MVLQRVASEGFWRSSMGSMGSSLGSRRLITILTWVCVLIWIAGALAEPPKSAMESNRRDRGANDSSLASPTPTTIPTTTATPTPEPLCDLGGGVDYFRWELLRVDLPQLDRIAFTWRVTNQTDSPLQRANFRFVPGTAIFAPPDASNYNSLNGHTYLVEHVITGAHPGIDFLPLDANPIVSDESDIFTFIVARSGVQNDTLLWYSAETVAGYRKQLDTRLQICFQLPPIPILVFEPAARYRLAGSETWDVLVTWQTNPAAPAPGFNLYRIGFGSSESILVNSEPIRANLEGAVSFRDLCPSGATSSYRIQPLDSLNAPLGPATEVNIEAFPTTVGQSFAPEVLAFLFIALGLLCRVRRGMLRSPPSASLWARHLSCSTSRPITCPGAVSLTDWRLPKQQASILQVHELQSGADLDRHFGLRWNTCKQVWQVSPIVRSSLMCCPWACCSPTVVCYDFNVAFGWC